MKIRTIYNLGDFNDNSVNNDPSETVQSDFEPISEQVARIRRGDIRPSDITGMTFDYDVGKDSLDDIMEAEQPFDYVDDISETGSPYQDDIVDALKAQQVDVTQQEREMSGAPQSSSESNVPVDNIDHEKE